MLLHVLLKGSSRQNRTQHLGESEQNSDMY